MVAITFEPLLVPFDKVPALVLKNTLAPLDGFAPPEHPGARFTERATGSVVPMRAGLIVPSSNRQACRWIPDHDPSALSLGNCAIVPSHGEVAV